MAPASGSASTARPAPVRSLRWQEGTARPREASWVEHPPHRLRSRWHRYVVHTKRIANRVDEHGGRGHDAALAAAFDAQRIALGRIFHQLAFKERQIGRARETIVHVRAGEYLSRSIEHHAFGQGLPRALRDRAVRLAVDDHWIDRLT